jgi:hypothetical protein
MDQLTQFSNELDALVRRYRHEADLTFAEVIGALQMKAWVLMAEASTRTDELEQP